MFLPLTLDSFVDRCKSLGFTNTYGTLWFLAMKPKYNVYEINKKDIKPFAKTHIILDEDMVAGGAEPDNAGHKKVRIISEPCPALKKVQRLILQAVLSPAKDSLLPCVHGCVEGRSTLTNAKPHVGATWKCHMDIRDFFPSIGTARVYGMFNKIFKYSKRLSYLLAKTCTFNDGLPQGAPTSPMIANFIAMSLDREIMRLISAMGGYYTRYVDDLTFSFRRRMPAEAGDRFIRTIQRIVEKHGFTVNEAKTSAHTRKGRMIVTGVVVNDVPSVPRSIRNNVRAAIHQRMKGSPSADAPHEIQGMISYINMINENQAAALKKYAASK